MKHQITKNSEGLDVKISGTEGNERQLLDAFRECQEGRCSCPTKEYQKLDGLQIEATPSGISLQLKAKPGTQIEQAEIERCLEYTERRTGKGPTE